MHVKKKNLPEVEKVKLKPVLGLKPGVWLTIVYAFLLLLIIFFAGILPDLKHGSKRVTFTSEVPGLAVYIDGNYRGATPFTVKVPSGDHKLEYKINSILLETVDFNVGHPVFFAWLFPRKDSAHSYAKLSEDAYLSVTEEFLNNVCAYSAVLEYDSVNHYPNLYTSYINQTKDSEFFDRKTFEKSVLFVTTKEMQKDAQNACDIVGINLAVQIQNNKADNVAKAFAKKVENGFSVNNSFVISKLPVSEAEYAEFMNSNPKWSKSNIENLKAEGLVDDYYLADFIGSPKRPVKNVSYYAAIAYCDWKGEKLPTEKQWMLACTAADQSYQKTLVSASDNNEISGMLGGLWEMTDTYYIPGDRNSDSSVQSFVKDWNIDCEIVVKGGSFINNSSDINIVTAGTAPKYMCSDFMGFRTVR